LAGEVMAMVDDEEPTRQLTRRQPSPTRLRGATQARQVRPRDTALVERATQALSIVELLGDEARDVSVPETTADADAAPVIVAPNRALAPAPRIGPVARRRRTWRSGVSVWVAAVLIIGATIAAVAPLAGRLGQNHFTPRGAALAANGASVQLSGPWDASAGAVNILGDGGGAGPGVHAPGSAGLPVSQQAPTPPPPAPATQPPSQPPAPVSPPSGISAAPVSPWPPSDAYMFVPGHPGSAFPEPAGDAYWWAYGQCTWWAQHERQDENLKRMGNAQYWAGSASARGYTVGSAPRAGATVVFQPGVEGAGGAGHVAHVVAVYPGGWFLVSEMNFYWNGGGWGRIDYRFAHSGWGVSFIY
jgi:hypothetical protein